jgi:hypothetical protein
MSASELVLSNGAGPATPASGKTALYGVLSPKRPGFTDDTGFTTALNGGEGTAYSAPSDPAGTTSTTGVMMGLVSGVPTFWAPHVTGKLLAIVFGWIANNTNGDGAKVQLRFGTGKGPANADALTGTAFGTLINFTAAAAAQKVPFMLIAITTGLTIGTNYWVDVGLAAVTGGTATIGGISQVLVEI